MPQCKTIIQKSKQYSNKLHDFIQQLKVGFTKCIISYTTIIKS